MKKFEFPVVEVTAMNVEAVALFDEETSVIK